MPKHMNYNLERFVSAQAGAYETALAEIRAERKQGHWIWYIFPQVSGLGWSHNSQYYALSGLAEAAAYMDHSLLKARLLEITNAVLQLPSTNPKDVFGSTDSMKLRSCMTLFAALPGANPVFQEVLNKFFEGTKDERTISIIDAQKTC